MPPEARDQALQALYEAEQRRSAPLTDDVGSRARRMVTGVWREKEVLDAAIGAASAGWRVERMPAVVRNILRRALWELRHRPETPVAVIISGAVRLAG